MMKNTIVLRWQSLVSKIHPPLPITSRDSAKLLKLIQTSFQKHLRQRYPNSGDTTESYTSQHFESILSHPLLQQRTNASAQKAGSRDSRSLSSLQEWMNEPLEVFRNKIIQGSASMESAKLCLRLQLRKCQRSPTLTLGNAMANASVSTVIKEWLWSSGLEENGSFLEDQDFVEPLIGFLVAEQRYGVLLKWFSWLRLRTHDSKFTSITGRARESTQSRLLLSMMKAEYKYGAGLGGAMFHFIQNFSRNQKSGNRQKEHILRPAGLYLSKMLAEVEKPGELPPDTLQSFLRSTETWAGSHSLIAAWQQAFRPDIPSADSTIRYVANLRKGDLDGFNQATRYMFIRLSIRAAEICITDNQHNHALAIMDLLRKHFAKEIGAKSEANYEASRVSPSADHEQTLHGLENIAI